jgi:hypothetical protein
VSRTPQNTDIQGMPTLGPIPSNIFARSIAALAKRCREESGVTLITAVMALSVLSAAGSSVVYFSSTNTRSAAYAETHQNALGFSEAGMNFARSTLWQAADPSNPNSVPTTAQQIEGVNVTYSGSFDSASQIWTLTGRAEVPNPTGAAPIIRTTSSKVRIASQQQGSTNNAIWTYLYQDDPTFCAEVANNVQLEIPVYTRGDLCVSNNASISSTSVQVLGNVEIGNNGSIGTAGNPIPEAHILGQCKYGSGGSGQWHSPCSAADRVYASVITTTPETLTKPPVDLPGWYAAAAPGPSNSCTQGNFPGGFDDDGFMNESLPEVDLAPSSIPYDCKVYNAGGELAGQISWTPGQGALPGLLTISGVIFFDGPVKINNNANVLYQGKGVIYATGQVLISNNAKLCGINGCTASWNPNINMLVFVAATTSTDDGFVVRNNGRFQGAAYVEQDFREWNNATVYGPIIARKVRIRNNAVHRFTPFSTLLPGMPASSTTSATLENVDGSFTSS